MMTILIGAVADVLYAIGRPVMIVLHNASKRR